MIGTALRIHALADSEISGLLGDRLRPGHLSEGDNESAAAATYQTISSVPDESLAGDAGHVTDRVQFDVYSDDESLAASIAKKLRLRNIAAFGSLPTSTGGSPPTVYVTGMSTAGGVRDLSSIAPVDGSDDWKHRLTFDLTVSYNPSQE